MSHPTSGTIDHPALRIDDLGLKAEARPYQRRIVRKTSDMFTGKYVNHRGEHECAAKSVMIESPTGSGKTVMGLMGIRELQQEIPDLVTGWVAMRRNLLTQAEHENAAKGIHVPNIHFTSMFDKEPSALIAARAAGRPIILCIDECQHDSTDSMASLHTAIKPDYILGLSATPFRVDRAKLLFDKVIKDAGIHALIQDGYLSRYHHYTIPKWDPATVAATYLREPDRWGKSIFYFVNLPQCYELQNLLTSAGIRCDVVTGSSSAKEREAQLEAFQDGAYNCLINCMVLTEGFDCPPLKTAWVRDSVKGPTMQMGGRVFRKHPSLPFKQIVQSGETHWPFIKTALPDEQYVWQEHEWRSLKVNPHINLMNANARQAIAEVQVKLPDFLLKKQAAKARRNAHRRLP